MTDTFNYISFGNWNLIEGHIERIRMSRARMFEYTPVELEKSLEALEPDALAFLEKLPTFLCSEIKSTLRGESMAIKFGRVSNIHLDGYEVVADYEVLIDFGVITFNNSRDALEIFEMVGLQIYRTHWAVRRGSADDILRKLRVLKPEIVAANETFDEIPAVPEAPAKKLLGEAESLEAFLNMLYDLPSEALSETFFRGHGDAEYDLTPSLLRKRSDGSWQFMENEDKLCKELLIAHYDEFQDDEYCFDRLVRMQHYGLPTRLLDITSNPLIALFFACVDKPNVDGEVITFRMHSDKIKYYSSDTVSCIANLSNLTFTQKNELTLSLDKEAFNPTSSAQKLLHHIKSEKGFFEERIEPFDLGSVVCVKAKQTNSRIKSQSGAFLLFGHDVSLPESGNEELKIHRIIIRNKKKILAQLNRININTTTVYPSIEQTAKHLRNQYLPRTS
jgi:FRG domain